MNDLKDEAEQAAREVWPSAHDYPERVAYEQGYLAGARQRPLPATDIIETGTANWGAITLLTSQKGSSVVVAHPGLDYKLEPCATVICRGPWTCDEPRYFTGRDLLAALSHAVRSFTEATRD